MSWSEIKKVNSYLSTPLNEGGVKIVKSVQRGVMYTVGSFQGTKEITIKQVDVEKSLVILDTSTDTSTFYGASLDSFESEKIVLKFKTVGTSNENRFSWQVIEFY